MGPSSYAGEVAAPIRIGTCSWADDALAKHWYPPGTPPKRAARVLRRALLDGRGRLDVLPRADRADGARLGGADAGGVRDAREGVRVDDAAPGEARAGAARPARGAAGRRRAAASTGRRASARAACSASSSTRSQPLREAGKLGGILFQMPPYVVWKPSSLDYLEWANDQLGGDRMLFEPRHRSWFAEEIRDELLRWLEERRMAWVVVDAPKVDAGNVPATLVAATTPLAYVRFHGRNAGTWNARGGSARAALRLPLRRGRAARVGRPAPRARRTQPRRRTRSSTTTTRRTASRRRLPARSCCASCSKRRTSRPPDARARRHPRAARAARALRRRDRRGRPRARRVGDPHARARRPTASTPCIVFGGDQNVGEELAHPWLHDEYDALAALGRRRRRRCSASASARRRSRTRSARDVAPRRRRPLAGFYETELTDAGARDPVLGVLPPALRGAERERATRSSVPAGRRRARDGARSPQAFRVGERAWARAVPPGGAPRPGARVVRRGRARRCRSRSTELAARARREARRVAGARPRGSAARFSRRGRGRGYGQLERQVVVARPLVPRADVVARVVAERAQHLRRDRRARAAVAVRDDLRARLERRARVAICVGVELHQPVDVEIDARPGCGPAAGRTACRALPSYSCARAHVDDRTSPSRAASSSSSMSLTASAARSRSRRRPTAARASSSSQRREPLAAARRRACRARGSPTGRTRCRRRGSRRRRAPSSRAASSFASPRRKA